MSICSLDVPCDEKMIVEDPRPNTACIYANIEDVFHNIEPRVGEVLRHTSRLFKDWRARRQDEFGIWTVSNALDQSSQIRISRGERSRIKRDFPEEVVKEEDLFLDVNYRRETIIEAADRDELPFLADVCVS